MAFEGLAVENLILIFLVCVAGVIYFSFLIRIPPSSDAQTKLNPNLS
jgi:hypothetical protein